MGRRRRSGSKKNNKCNICNKLYASRQSLYFHNYTYHRHQTNEINIGNNVEIYHNVDNSDNISALSDNTSQIDVELFNEHIDNHLISNYIKKINIVKDSIASKILNLNEENKIIEETKKIVETNHVEEKHKIEELIEEPIEKAPVQEIKNIFIEKPFSEEKIINDVTLLLNNCIGNNIGISINVELSNSTITVINKLKN